MLEFFLYFVVVLSLSFAVDTKFGEPPMKIHPVALIGKIAEKLIKLFEGKNLWEKISDKKSVPLQAERRTLKEKVIQYIKGVNLILICVIIYVFAYILVKLIIRTSLSSVANSEPIFTFIFIFTNLLVDVFFLKTTFSVKLMEKYAKDIFDELEKNNLQKAREITSHIVSRDTKNLDKEHIVSATIESVSENFVDSVFSPIFYFTIFSIFGFLISVNSQSAVELIGFGEKSKFLQISPCEFGIIGAITFRVINTLDAMVGYHIYGEFGLPSAKLDDFLNFIPARVSPILIILSGYITGYMRREDYKDVINTIVKSKNKTKSQNSWIPISAFSGILRIKLEKIGEYSIGDDFPLPQPEKINQAVKLFHTSSLLTLISAIIISVILITLFVETRLLFQKRT